MHFSKGRATVCTLASDGPIADVAHTMLDLSRDLLRVATDTNSTWHSNIALPSATITTSRAETPILQQLLKFQLATENHLMLFAESK